MSKVNNLDKIIKETADIIYI